jgi:hypothetical protein
VAEDEPKPNKFAALMNKLSSVKSMRDMEEEEEKEYIAWQEQRLQSISNHIVEYFPKVMFFHSVIVA